MENASEECDDKKQKREERYEGRMEKEGKEEGNRRQ